MFTYKQHSALNLTETDAALIFKEDGTLEASLPEITSDTVPENVFTGAAIVYALNNPEICQLIYQTFAQECARRKDISAAILHCSSSF